MKKIFFYTGILLLLLIQQSCGLFRSAVRRNTDFNDTIKIQIDTLKRDEGQSLINDSSFIDTLAPVHDTVRLLSDSTLLTLQDTLPDTLSIIMVGDVMLGTNYPNSSYLPPQNDCWPLLEPLAEELQDADISFCNLEGVFAGEKGTAKYCRDPKTCYVFRMPDEYISCITAAGFDLVSVANNHVNDFGYQGQINTVNVLNAAGLHFAGFSNYPYTIFESKGLLIGFCAFSPNKGVQDLRDIAGASKIVSFLSDTCDLVLVSMHGGAEGAKYQHVTRSREVFLGADRGNVYEFAHSMIDAGADIIMGHGPHVTRGMEIYNNRFIAYSLGNFATYARFNISGPNGIAPAVKIFINRDGEFLNGQIIPVKQSGEGGAQYDPDKKVIFKLQELQKSDFPENQIIIDNNGNINFNSSKE